MEDNMKIGEEIGKIESKYMDITFNKVEVTEENLRKLMDENARLEYELEREKRYRKCMYFNAKYDKDAAEYYKKLYDNEVSKNDELMIILVGLISSAILISLAIVCY
jgi:hypothetical protein